MNYVSHLSKDRKLKRLISQQGEMKLEKRKNVCFLLCASILSQQLATNVARVIKQRFLDLFGGKIPEPQQIIDMPFEKLRAIGLSNAKAMYVKNVARFALERGMDFRKLNRMTNEEIIQYLTEIKGVGRWTVEMLLMFTLGREDVFSSGDMGIQNAMIRLYGLKEKNKKKLIEKLNSISGNWKPYRTYACMHLWQFKDNTPVIKKKKMISGRKIRH